MSAALYVLLALLGFGFVIAIHELGHFLFAKWAGVRVEVFSIGFGPRLLTWRGGETEYSLSLLPFGGYVKMTGQEDMPQAPDAPTPAPDPRSYLSARPGWKALILLGGVLFNFLSSYVLLIALAFWGYPVLRPVVGEVAETITTAKAQVVPSPAATAGLRVGDEITALDGEKVRSFEDLAASTIAAGNRPVTITVRRGSETVTLGPVAPVYDQVSGRPSLGIAPGRSARVAEAGEGPVAAGERITQVNGQALPEGITGQEMVYRLQPLLGQPATVTVTGPKGSREEPLTYGGADGGLEATLGLPVRVAQVVVGSPAAEAGLVPGDVILSVDGAPALGSAQATGLLWGALQRSERVTLTIRRADGSSATILLHGREMAGRRRVGLALETVISGILPVVVPAVDGKPSAAEVAGLAPGQAMVATTPPAPGSTQVQTYVVDGGAGARVLLPLEQASVEGLLRQRTVGRLARLMGDRGQPSALSQMVGTQVVATLGPDGRAGSPAPGLIQVRTAAGSERSVDLAALGDATEAVIRQLQVGDWIVGLSRTAQGQQALDLVRGTTGPAREVVLAGRTVGQRLFFDDMEVVPYRLESPAEAFAIANHATHTMIVKSCTFLVRFFQPPESGGLDASKSLQGPIGIFRELKARAERFGLDSYLNLVALIGLNLVLVNLLPIPITDGGQLVFLAIETAIGRPLPEIVRTVLGYLGLALVVSLMLFATALDIGRLL